MYPISLIKKIGPFRSKLKAPIDFKRFFNFADFCRFSIKKHVFLAKNRPKKGPILLKFEKLIKVPQIQNMAKFGVNWTIF